MSSETWITEMAFILDLCNSLFKYSLAKKNLTSLGKLLERIFLFVDANKWSSYDLVRELMGLNKTYGY